MYQHEWTHGQHVMHLLFLFSSIGKIDLQSTLDFYTHHWILKDFYPLFILIFETYDTWTK